MPNNDFGHNFSQSCRILLNFCTPPRESQNETFLLNKFFSYFKYLVRRGICSFAENAKIRQNSAFEPKPNVVAEKFYLENQPPTYLGKVKKNQNCHQSKIFHGRHNKKVRAFNAPPPW